uniref:Uncharacterized protein n=1 Tax=uncultured bacterium Contig643 TaxID=1393602 RepID=W0FMP4_9BACT|nr:hypothetical protein [uncultured bacterium Contig643]
MNPSTQVSRSALNCLATMVRIEYTEKAKDPEFMQRFEAWKAAREAAKKEGAKA